jgi:hypothetical protein
MTDPELQIENETGDFQVFGPTSSLRHLVATRPRDRPPPDVQEEPLQQQLRQSNMLARKHTADNIDFRRYLPSGSEITWYEHDKALDYFFRYHASWGEHQAVSFNFDSLTTDFCIGSRPTNTPDPLPTRHANCPFPWLSSTRSTSNTSLLPHASQCHAIYRPTLF